MEIGVFGMKIWNEVVRECEEYGSPSGEVIDLVFPIASQFNLIEPIDYYGKIDDDPLVIFDEDIYWKIRKRFTEKEINDASRQTSLNI